MTDADRARLKAMGFDVPDGAKVLGTVLPKNLEAPRKRNKYGAKPTFYGGIRFASTAEAARAHALDLLFEVGVRYLRQPRFTLGCPENVYVGDFLTWGGINHWGVHVEDTKGVETAKFKKDKRLWKSYGPCPLWLIKGGKVVEVIEGGLQP